MTKRNKSPRRVGRREAIAGVGAVALGASFAAAGIARRGVSSDDGAPEDEVISGGAEAVSAATDREALSDADRAVTDLFGSIAVGTAVSTHWRVEKIHAVRAGAIPVVMSTIYGDRFALEVFRDSANGPTPITRTRGLALFLVNGGDGGSPTDELFGLGVMALGAALENEATTASIPSALLPHAERHARYPNGAFDIPTA
ncbi:MAG: hypothetical protein AB8I08_26505 [Sandaracinaceae bacterium]